MIKFKLESSSEPGVNTGWVPNTVDGHASIKASVEEVIFRNAPRPAGRGSAVSVAVKADPEFSDEELVNLVALSSKCWHHLAFMAGLKIGSQDRTGFISQLRNPWSTLKRGLEENDSFSVFDALDSTRLGTGAVLAGRDRVVTFKLFRNSPVGVMAAAWRLANMAEWTLKFTQELRLTSDTKLKWETFNAITAHILRGIEPSTQARGQERLSMEQLVERARRLTPRGALAPAQALSVQDLVDGQEYRLRLGRIGDTGQQNPLPDWEAWQQCLLRLERSEEGVTSLTPPRPGWPTYDPRRDFIPQAEETTASSHRFLDWARQSATPYSPHGLFLVEDYCMQIEGVICLTTPAVLTGVAHE